MKTLINSKQSAGKGFFLGMAIVAVFWLSSCSEDTVGEFEFGTLTGNVVSKGDNTPLENAKITTSPVSNTVFTNAEGYFEINEIQSGEYSVQAELADFETAFEATNVLKGRAAKIIMELDSLAVDNSAPLLPNLLFPEDGSENVGTSVEFRWTSSENDEDEIEYTLELRNGATNEMTVYETIKDTTLAVDNLIIGRRYFWQVSATDGTDSRVQSALSGFTVKSNTANRFLYVRNVAGNNVLFSGAEPIGSSDEDLDQNEVQLTSSNVNSYRPSMNNTVSKIAFLRSVGGDTHLFTMNADGTDIKQVTKSVPLTGFRHDQLEYAWYNNGASLYFPNFNKLYSIGQDGSGIEMVYQTGDAEFITEVAVNTVNDLVALKTNDINGYNARIIVVDVTVDAEQEVVTAGQPGALGGLDFSTDGTKILFTEDVSGVENKEYRRLDSRIFEYNLTSDTIIEIDTQKEQGTNDMDPKYSPDDGSIIFVNTSNDGISERRIYRIAEGSNNRRETLFTNASMPDWE